MLFLTFPSAEVCKWSNVDLFRYGPNVHIDFVGGTPGIWAMVKVWPITSPTPRPISYHVQWCREYCISQKLLTLQCDEDTSWYMTFKCKNLYTLLVFKKKLLRMHFNNVDLDSPILVVGKEMNHHEWLGVFFFKIIRMVVFLYRHTFALTNI